VGTVSLSRTLDTPVPTEASDWLLSLPYPVRNAIRRWPSLVGMTVGVGIALSIGMTLLAVISAEMDLLTGDYQRSGISVYTVTQGGKLIARLAGETPGTIQNGTTILAQIRSWPGVHSAIGVLSSTMTRQDEGPRRRGQLTELIAVMGINGDPTQVRGLMALDAGHWLRNPNDVVLGRNLARDKHLSLGDSMRLNGASFTVVGVGKLRGFSAFGQDAVAYMQYPTLLQRAQLANVLNVIAIQTSQPAEISGRLDDLGGLASSTPDQLVADAQQASASGIAIDWILIVMTLAIAGLFVSTMLNHSVAERRAEFAVLRAIGLPASSVLLTVALEAVTITVAAGLLGVAISLGFGVLIDVLVARQYGFDSLYRADASLFLVIFVLASALGLVSGIVPARKAASVDPVEVLREV
jgi:lipoprotein-releasing system permease protein